MSDLVDPFVCPCCGSDATKLRILADYIEVAWHLRSDRTEVQDDLRKWASTIESGD